MNIKLKISHKISLIIITLILIIYIISSIIIYNDIKDELLKKTLDDFHNLSLHNSELVTKEFEKAYYILTSIANLIKNYDFNKTEGRAKTLEIMDITFSHNNIYNALWLISEKNYNDKLFIKKLGANSTGRFTPFYYRYSILTNEKFFGTTEDSLCNEDFYTIPARELKPLLLEPYKDSYNDIDTLLMTSIAYPLISGNKFKGVIGVDFSLDFINNLLKNVRPLNEGFVFIVTENGNVIGHYHNKYNLKNYKTVINKYNEDNYLIVSHPFNIKNIRNWYFYVVIKKDVIFQPLIKLKYIFIIVSVLLSLTIILTIFILTNIVIQKPIDKLINFAQNIQLGLFPDYVKFRNDEFGELEKSFNSVKDTIKNIIDDIKFYNKNQVLGDWDFALVPDHYNNEYKKLVESINEISNMHIDNLKYILSVIDEFSQGNFIVDIKEFSNKKIIITQSLYQLKSIIKNLLYEIEYLNQKIYNNDFSYNINEDLYEGDLKNIVTTLNSISQKFCDLYSEFNANNDKLKISINLIEQLIQKISELNETTLNKFDYNEERLKEIVEDFSKYESQTLNNNSDNYFANDFNKILIFLNQTQNNFVLYKNFISSLQKIIIELQEEVSNMKDIINKLN